MGEVTRRAVLAVILAGPAMGFCILPALAQDEGVDEGVDEAGGEGGGDGGSDAASAGTSVTADLDADKDLLIPTSRTRYTKIKFANRGPGPANIEISNSKYNKTFVIEEGGEVTVTEIFGSKETKIANKSTSATVRIESRWL